MPNAIIEVKLQPRASKNEVLGFRGNVLYLRVTAAPVDGDANTACLKLLSGILGIPKTSIVFITGKKARYKIVKLEGLTYEEVKKKLSKEN